MKITDINNFNPIKIYKYENIPTFTQSYQEYEKDVFIKADMPDILNFKIETDSRAYGFNVVSVMQNPLDKALIYKKIPDEKTHKIKKIPYMVDIATHVEGSETTFHFLEPDTKEELGFVIVSDLRQGGNRYTTKNFLKDYEEEGIVGDRVSIEYLANNKEHDYGGIGEASDQIAVEYCLRNGITPNIISNAGVNSYAAHYIRGKRFFSVDKYMDEESMCKFIEANKTKDPNKVIKERIEETPKGEEVYCVDLGSLLMYMPEEMVQRQIKKAKLNPILH